METVKNESAKKEIKIEIWEIFEQLGVIPVVVLNRPEDAKPLGQALLDGGLPCAEVTFRTDAAAEAIASLRETYPEMLVGAGTVLSTEQVDQALAAGAQFMVAPGLNETVVAYCLEKGVPIVPGCMDTYAIERAMALGLDTLKFFPAEAAGGTAMIKALSGPYRHLKFIPTGGIKEGNLADYLALPQVLACGGSWMVPGKWIDGGDFDAIREKAREAVEIVRQVRGGKA